MQLARFPRLSSVRSCLPVLKSSTQIYLFLEIKAFALKNIKYFLLIVHTSFLNFRPLSTALITLTKIFSSYDKPEINN